MLARSLFLAALFVSAAASAQEVEPSEPLLPGLDTALPLPADAAAQPLTATAVAGDPGVRHFEDGRGADEPWLPPLVPPSPPGRSHFVIGAGGGVVGGGLYVPSIEGFLGVEGYTGVVRLRGLLVGGYEAVEGGACAPPYYDCETQGGATLLARGVIGAELLDWISLRGALDIGMQFGRNVWIATDAFVELAFRLTDERRVELGIDGGLASRNFGGGSWLDFGMRLSGFVGFVL